MIRLENVSKYYNTTENITMGLTKVNASFDSGEIVAIVGESGSGKSTFLNVLTQIDSFDEGEIYYNNTPLSTLSREEIENFRRENIGFVFQNYNLIESHSVLDNVMLPLLFKGVSNKEAKERALKVIEEVGLTKRLHNKAAKLSGGEKQRLVIARALIVDSKILACDEPTGNLDSKTGAEIVKLLHKVSKGRLVLIVTHNYDEIKDIATRKLRFKDGSLIEDVTLREYNPELIEEEKTLEKSKKFSFAKTIENAYKNLISTPKKTILTLITFLAIGICIAVLYGVLLQLNKDTIILDNRYTNFDGNRIVCYDETQQALDIEKINKIKGIANVYDNTFYEDYIFGVNGCYGSNEKFKGSLEGNFDEVSSSLVGRMPSSKNEIVVSVSPYLFNDRALQRILNSSYQITSVPYTITVVGIYHSNFYNYADPSSNVRTMVVYGNDEFMTEMKASLIAEKGTTSFDTIQINKLSISSDQPKGRIQYFTTANNKNIIEQNQLQLGLTLGGYRFNINTPIDYETDMITYSESKGVMIMNPEDFMEMFDGVYQASIYVRNPQDISHIAKKLEKLGYTVMIPTQSGQPQSKDAQNNLVTRVVTIIIVVAVLIILFFVGYFVLSRIYYTKVKEYTLLRTIGATRRTILNIVILELLMVSLVSSALIVGCIPVVSKICDINVIYVYTYYEYYKIFIFVALMLIIAVLVGVRFNNRVFKYSVQTSLKKEAMNHD